MNDIPLSGQDRLTSGLGALSRMILLSAALLPVGTWLGRTVVPQSHLQWSIVEFQAGRVDDEHLRHDTPRSSLTVEVINTGPRNSDEVRVEFAGSPEAVHVGQSPNDARTTTDGNGNTVDLGRLRLGELAQVTIFRDVFSDVSVLDGTR